MAITQEYGKKGEDLACQYLKEKGYTIVKRNYKCKLGEIDIIAKKGEYVAFVEVKSRSQSNYGLPSQMVFAKQRERYKNTANYYFYGKEIDCIVRFDIIEVYLGETPRVNHIENAF